MGLAGFRATSAGTQAMIARPIHPEAAIVLQKLGGDASNFAARQLTPAIASDADLVVTMTRTHRDQVLALAPRQLRNTFTLGEASLIASTFNPRTLSELAAHRSKLSSDGYDIADPIGQDADVFAEVGSQIARLLAPLLELCRSA